MVLKFNPRITGGFVHRVMNSRSVSEEMQEIGLNKDTAHNIVKAILIAGFNELDIDINEIINEVRDSIPQEAVR